MAFSPCKLVCECMSRNNWSIYVFVLSAFTYFHGLDGGDYRFVQMNKYLQSRTLLNGR